MARRQNSIATVHLTISTTVGVKSYLTALVETGLYGKTEAEAAERMISQGVERALVSGTIPRIRPVGAET